MSRGAGRLQRKILEALTPSTPLLNNKLCWELAFAEGKVLTGHPVAGIRQGVIEKAFYSSFNRAVAQLAESGRVVVASRKLRNLDELIGFYPFKTRDLTIRELREKLLPAIPPFYLW